MSQQVNAAIPTHKNGRKAKVSPPVVHIPKAWPAEEKAHWIEALAQWIEDGGSLSSFCREYPQGPCKTAWFEWINGDPIIADRYARARENGADTLAEETVAIADEVKDAGQFDSARVNAARLRVRRSQMGRIETQTKDVCRQTGDRAKRHLDSDSQRHG